MSSAPAVVTTLNVDPGGYRSRYARASAGFVGSRLSRPTRGCTLFVSWPASGFGSNEGFEYIASTCAGLDVERDHGALLAPERVARGLLRGQRLGEHDVAGGLLAGEHLPDVVELELPVLAGELVVVAGFDAGVADDERLVPADRR